MQFVRVGDEYINAVTIERVTVRRDGHGVVTLAEFHLIGQYGHVLTLEGAEAAALVAALDELCVGHRAADRRDRA